MTTTENTEQTEQSIPTLADLFGFDVPRLDAYYPSAYEMRYTLKGDNEDLERLKNAVKNAHETLHLGIEAIADLLICIDINCPEEAKRNSRIDALDLVAELSKMLDSTSQAAWKLEHTTAEPPDPATTQK
jgi:hypothetical protein